MHDLDRVSMQREGEFQSEAHDFEGEGNGYGAPLGEAEVLELAAELLNASHQGQVEHVIAETVSRSAGSLHPETSHALHQTVTPLVKRALPSAQAPSSAGQRTSHEAFLGLELEGLSREDRELEVAKQLVRLASTAAAIAASAPEHVPPHAAVRTAVSEAAAQFAPGLLRSPFDGSDRDDDRGYQNHDHHHQRSSHRGGSQGGYSSPADGLAHSGRWIRRGNKIILLGV